MKRSFPDDLVIGNLSRRGFLKGVGATGVLLVAANWAGATPWPPRRRPSAPTPCPTAGWTTRRST